MFGKIIILSLVLVMIFINSSYAKYTYNIHERIINLTRDTILPIGIINYSSLLPEYTNQNVKVSVNFNKEVEYLDGFTKIDDYNFEKEYEFNTEENIRFKDYSGNVGTVMINVNNIDKELPEVIINNPGSLPLSLTYTDNLGIESIDVKKYGSYLSMKLLDFYYNYKDRHGLDVYDTYMYVSIVTRPLNTVKYKYYLNDNLIYFTDSLKVKFDGLTSNTKYSVRVEAIDANGGIVGSQTINITTHVFSNAIDYNTDTIAQMTLQNIREDIGRVEVAMWSEEDASYIEWAYPIINEDRSLTYAFNREEFKYTDKSYKYRIHYHFFDVDGNHISTLPCNIKFGDIPIENILDLEDTDMINQSGTYVITVKDIAGNILEKKITI